MKLNHKIFGEGEETMIILHGLLGSLDNWQSLAIRFSEKRRVITVDQRNHGKSPHEDGLSYKLMASDLKELMDDLNIEKAILLGHSMGGKAVMQFAFDYPDRVKDLIVADMNPSESVPHHQKIFEALNSMDVDNLKTRGEADKHVAQYISDIGVRQFLLKNVDRTPDGFKWKVNLKAINEDYYEILAGVGDGQLYTGNALFIRGGRSNYILDPDIDDILELFPIAKLETIEEAGHWLHAEKPNEFYDIVENYLS
jgi:pimeloyl-ACP methyl ester carboxylesterase